MRPIWSDPSEIYGPKWLQVHQASMPPIDLADRPLGQAGDSVE